MYVALSGLGVGVGAGGGGIVGACGYCFLGAFPGLRQRVALVFYPMCLPPTTKTKLYPGR